MKHSAPRPHPLEKHFMLPVAHCDHPPFRGGGCRLGRLCYALGLAILCASGGCASGPWHLCGPRSNAGPEPWNNPHLVMPERLDQGYVLVLPGAWGNAPSDHGLVMGLKAANFPAAIELHDWTAGAFLLLYNLRALDRNREEAGKIAQKIITYQDRYPGRPVHLVGYSGGGGLAVLTLEALPQEHRVTNAVLLAATLAADYDLRTAISRTESGIANFYSPWDAVILGAGVAAVGTTEGRHTIAAGATGFIPPEGLSPAEVAQYTQHVSQHMYQWDMLTQGHPGGHFGWTSPAFVTRHVAPVLAVGHGETGGSAIASRAVPRRPDFQSDPTRTASQSDSVRPFQPVSFGEPQRAMGEGISRER